MKNILIVFVLILAFENFSCKSKSPNKVKPFFNPSSVIISELSAYENKDGFFPFDYFQKSDILESPLSIKTTADKNILITNVYNDGLTGFEVNITITPNLVVKDVTYHSWTDVIDGSEVKFYVQEIILELNTNPFLHKENLIGSYTLKIKSEYKRCPHCEAEESSITFFVFHGKFKSYSEEEKKKGLEKIKYESETKMYDYDEDSFGVFLIPEKAASFRDGERELKKKLNMVSIFKRDIPNLKQDYISVELIIDEKGRIFKDKMKLMQEIPIPIQEKVKEEILKLGDWFPAVYQNKFVKSRTFLSIKLRNH